MRSLMLDNLCLSTNFDGEQNQLGPAKETSLTITNFDGEHKATGNSKGKHALAPSTNFDGEHTPTGSS